jgi:hypothetical protein
VRSNPWPNCNVRDSNAVADDEASRGRGEVVFEDAVEAVGLSGVAIDRVREFFRCETSSTCYL